MLSSRYLSLIERISNLADAHGRQVFLVGGVVRDLIRGVPPGDADVDFLVDVNGIEFAQICAQKLKGVAQSFPTFLTAKVLAPSELPGIAEIDFATARKESYRQPGALPTVAPAGVAEDLGRRDFTINSMAIPARAILDLSRSGGVTRESLHSVVLDPHNGWADLENRVVRVLHNRSFVDDPTRIFRACRYAARIGGVCAPETTKCIQEAIVEGALGTISPQRKLNEMKHVVGETNPGRVAQLLVDFGVFRAFHLFDPLNVSLVSSALERLRGTTGALSVEQREKAALRIFYAYADRSIREGVFEEFALGKKIVKRIQDDLVLGEGEGEIQSLSVEGLLAIGAIGSERATEAAQLLADRGIEVPLV